MIVDTWRPLKGQSINEFQAGSADAAKRESVGHHSLGEAALPAEGEANHEWVPRRLLSLINAEKLAPFLCTSDWIESVALSHSDDWLRLIKERRDSMPHAWLCDAIQDVLCDASHPPSPSDESRRTRRCVLLALLEATKNPVAPPGQDPAVYTFKLQQAAAICNGVLADVPFTPEQRDAVEILQSALRDLSLPASRFWHDPGDARSDTPGSQRVTSEEVVIKSDELPRFDVPNEESPPTAQRDDLTDLQLDILESLRQRNATSQQERSIGEDVAKTVGGGATPHSVKAPLADLRRRGLVDSKTGRSGGTWLTPDGLTLINLTRPQE